MNKATTVLILLLLLVTQASAQVSGDTDGVVARGLIPLEDAPQSLAIIKETVRVIMYADVMRTERTYVVENKRARATFLMANVCGGPSVLDADCGRVTIDGAVPRLDRRIGYLVDDSLSVSRREKSRDEVERCLEVIDGGVCGHEWIEFRIALDHGQQTVIQLSYDSDYAEPYWIEQIARQLYLYSERFFLPYSISSLLISIEVAGSDFELETWTPRGLYARHSTSPSRADGGVIVWNFSNFSSHETSGFMGLIHPWAMDRDAIRAAHGSAIRSDAERPNKR